MGSLHAKVETREEAEIELSFRFEHEGFSGVGTTWFSIHDVGLLIERFMDYPLKADDPPQIIGGYGQRGNILQEHVFVMVAPSGLTGNLLISVRLSAQRYESTDPKLSLHGEFTTSYQQVAQFVQDFKLLLEGLKSCAVLESKK